MELLDGYRFADACYVEGRAQEQVSKDGEPAPREAPPSPQLNRPIYQQLLRPQWSASTRQALDQAANVQDWNSLYLSAPEFMYL